MRLVPNAGEIRAAIQSYLLLLSGDRGFIDPKISMVVFGAVPENWKTTDPLYLATSSADSPEDKHNLIKAGWRM